ncbi:MAG: hypothetical protein ACYC0X_15480 [Pirellulaceae bacterium]
MATGKHARPSVGRSTPFTSRPQGWSKDPDSTATYALTVSFESLGEQIQIYEDLQLAVQELQAEIEAEEEVQLEVGEE